MKVKGNLIIGEEVYNKIYVGQATVFRKYTIPFMDATGGNISYSGDYKIHQFTGSGTFTVTRLGGTNTVDFVVVAGGGSKGKGLNYDGGGGGAGGCIYTEGTSVGLTSYSIVIGAGGAYPASAADGNNGSNSSALGVTCTGGGGGGKGGDFNGNGAQTGRSGGSGGGGGAGNNWHDGGTGISGQGYKGGSTSGGTTSGEQPGGGGGAGGVGNAGGYGGAGKSAGTFGFFSRGGPNQSYLYEPGCGGPNQYKHDEGRDGIVYIRYKYK